MTISPALLDKPLPFTITLPVDLETRLYRYIAREEDCASFVCRRWPGTAKPATTFTMRFDGLDRESLADFFKSDDDMIEGLSYMDVWEIPRLAMCGDDHMQGFLEMLTQFKDHNHQPLHELVDFRPERALSSIVLASRDDGDAVCDVNEYVTYEDAIPSGKAIQTIPGNMAILFHEGATITVEQASTEVCETHGEIRFNMILTIGLSIDIFDHSCFLVHTNLLG